MNPIPLRLQRNITDLFGAEGSEWLSRLPETIASCERCWSVIASPPLEGLSYSYVAPATRQDGCQVILKLGFPNPELSSEVKALEFFDGRGCVRLLGADLDQGALLLEHLQPGTPLSHLQDDEATRIAAAVMRRLWRPVGVAHSFRSVADWAVGLQRLRARFGGGTGPLPAKMVERAERSFAELLSSDAELLRLHGDLHHNNILRAQRQPWIAIDPKGIMGAPSYDAATLLLSRLDPTQPRPVSIQRIARCADTLGEELGLDQVKLLQWAFAQAVLSAWWHIEDHGRGSEIDIIKAELVEQAMR